MAHRRRWTLVAAITLALSLVAGCQQSLSLVTLRITDEGGSGRVEVAGQVHALPWADGFPDGSTVVVRAVPDAGSVFVGWSGDASGSANPLSLTLSGPLEIGARFEAQTSNGVVVWRFGSTSVTVSGTVGGGPPDAGATVLANGGNVEATYAITSDRVWLAAAPATGALGAGQAAEIDILVGVCTAYGSEIGTLVAAGGGASTSLAVRRDCSEPGAEPSVDLALDRLYVNQSVPAQDSAQNAADRIPLVADRPGLLRVFVSADRANTARPIVRLHYRHGGGPENSIVLAGPATVPLTTDEGDLGGTFNALLDADVVGTGLEAYVVVELDGETDPSNNRYPASGWWTPVVLAVPEASFTIVPITYRGVTPNVGDGRAYIGLTERMFPLAEVDVQVRAPVTFTGDLAQGTGWGQLLEDLTELRSTDASSRHYYGVVHPGYTSGIAGIGWVGGYPAAVGWSHLPSGAEVATHELGHNWGRSHAPCGVAGDPAYPHAGGAIGVWGYDRATSKLFSPDAHADVMSYCGPVWTSDYTYEGVRAYRVQRGYREVSTSATDPSTVLLVSGRIADADGSVELDPVLVTQGRPSPTVGGAYDLIALDVDGREIARMAFDTVEMSHVHIDGFTLAVPVDAGAAERIGAIRVEAAGRLLFERRPALRTLAVAPTVVAPQGDGSVEIVWDAVAYRELMVRYVDGGEVLGRDRTGRLRVSADGRALELLLSDGLNTVREVVGY